MSHSRNIAIIYSTLLYYKQDKKGKEEYFTLKIIYRIRSNVHKTRKSFQISSDLLRCSTDVALVHPLGETKRVQGLVQVVFPRRKVDEHQRLRVTAERVHQEVGELRVAVRYVRVLLQKEISIN